MSAEAGGEHVQARFHFESPELKVEFRGTEEFVTEQVDLVRKRIREILRSAPGADGEEAPADAPTGEDAPTLEEFYLRAKTREGRGALQDSILIFAHYMLTHQGKHEFSIEDLNFCFDLLNIQRPRSLANTLGIIKRDRKLLHSGSKRGTYTLSDKELKFLKQFVGIDRGDFFNHEWKTYQCSGGMNLFSTLPNGDTYTCVTGRYQESNLVGNVFDPDFKPSTKPVICRTISCAGCDLDKVTRIPVDEVAP